MLRYLCIFLLVACGSVDEPPPTALPPTPFPAVTGRSVTMDGFDPATGTIIAPINIWKNYTDRTQGVVGTVLHGQYVTMIRQEGDGVLIQTPTGIRGWVSKSFIKELH